MNFKQMMIDELEEKGQNWTLLQKIQYIYQRTGEEFIYNDHWTNTTDEQLKQEIISLRLNQENITEKRIVCSTWSHLFTDLLNDLFKNNPEYKKSEVIVGEGHGFVNVHLTSASFIADMTIGQQNDFFKIKHGLMPSCFVVMDVNQTDDEYSDYLDLVDENWKVINYLKVPNYKDYFDLVKNEFTKDKSKQDLYNSYIKLTKKFMDYLILTTNFENKSLIDIEAIYTYAFNQVIAPIFGNKTSIKNLRLFNEETNESSFISFITPINEYKNITYITTRGNDIKETIKTVPLKEDVKKYIKKYQYNPKRLHDIIDI